GTFHWCACSEYFGGCLYSDQFDFIRPFETSKSYNDHVLVQCRRMLTCLASSVGHPNAHFLSPGPHRNCFLSGRAQATAISPSFVITSWRRTAILGFAVHPYRIQYRTRPGVTSINSALES